jgi:hypothetical protein
VRDGFEEERTRAAHSCRSALTPRVQNARTARSPKRDLDQRRTARRCALEPATKLLADLCARSGGEAHSDRAVCARARASRCDGLSRGLL